MHVTGHDHEHIHLHIGVMPGQLTPHGLHHLPWGVQYHLSLDNLSENAVTVLRADRDEIRPGLRVIVRGQAD